MQAHRHITTRYGSVVPLVVIILITSLLTTAPSHAQESNPGQQSVLAPEPTIDEIRAQAEAGDINSQIAMASLYFSGKGVDERDPEAGLRWLYKAAESQSPEAYFNIGLVYEQGYNGPADLARAAYWFTKAAEAGDYDAQIRLTKMYSLGEGVQPNPEQALKWNQKAAESENPEAIYQLAAMFANGTGTEIDNAKYIELLSSAAEKGFTRAQMQLGHELLSGERTDKDLQKAGQWFEKAAENDDNAAAFFELGALTIENDDSDESYTKAIEYFSKAAALEDPRAAFNIGVFHERGNGVPANLNEALNWYVKAAKLGHFPATVRLATTFDDADTMLYDPVAAMKWYSLAVLLADSQKRDDLDAISTHRNRLAELMTTDQILEAERELSDFLQGPQPDEVSSPE